MNNYLLKQDIVDIKALLKRLEDEGVESIYKSFSEMRFSNGSSLYSALINEIIACCPSKEAWKNPREREKFSYDVKYYCDYYLTLANEKQ